MEKGDHSSIIYGTHFPNRLFVGCLPPLATADDLGRFFSSFGKVVEAKVVLDEHRRSKRFGFVSFAKQEEAESVLEQGAVYLMGKKINVGPAVKKQVKDSVPQVPVKIVTSTPVADQTSEEQIPVSTHKPKYTYSIRENPLTSIESPPNSPDNRHSFPPNAIHVSSLEKSPLSSLPSSPARMDGTFGSTPISLLTRSPQRINDTPPQSPPTHVPMFSYCNSATSLPTSGNSTSPMFASQSGQFLYPISNPGYLPWSSEYQPHSPASLTPSMYSPPPISSPAFYPPTSVPAGSSIYATSSFPSFGSCQQMPQTFQPQPYFLMPTYVY